MRHFREQQHGIEKTWRGCTISVKPTREEFGRTRSGNPTYLPPGAGYDVAVACPRVPSPEADLRHFGLNYVSRHPSTTVASALREGRAAVKRILRGNR